MKKTFFKLLVSICVLAMLLFSVQVPSFAADETDLALNKTVTVSGVWDAVPDESKYYLGENITDGDETTRWAGKMDDDGMFWCVIDLGEEKSFNKVVVKFEMCGGTFDLEYSKDGATYEAIETELQGTNNFKDQEEIGPDEITFSMVSGRYIRLISVSYMSIWTLNAYETQVPTVAPTTEAPTTQAPATSAPATEAPTETTADTTTSATEDEEPSDNALTIIIIIGALVVISGVVFIIMKKKNASK